MRRTLFSILLLMGCSLCSCCSDDDETDRSASSYSTMEFGVKPVASGFNFAEHMNRVYVGERKPEHEKEELHVHSMSDLYSPDGNTLWFRETGLVPQWYKFIVLSVPKIVPGTEMNRRNYEIFTEDVPGSSSCDLNQHKINYLPILEKAPGSETPHHDLPDGDIFRAVLNRWPQEHLMIEEDIVLHRLNGLLEIDMGILADQFENKVTQVVVQLETPTQLYIADNNIDQIKTAEMKLCSFQTIPEDQRALPENQRTHHIIRMNLLPGVINGETGQIIVKTDQDETFAFPLIGSNGYVEIKQNTRLKLTFNGIYHGYFDVKYAGYDQTGMDVEDQWNGGW